MSNDNLNKKEVEVHKINPRNNSQNVASGVIVVDPTKMSDGSDRYVKKEDLTMYVNLTAQKVGSTAMYNNFDNDEDEINVISDMGFMNFMNPLDENGNQKGVFTTDWTELFSAVKPKDGEGLGIESIEIKFNASFLPEIYIELTDVRGKTLFERGNDPNNPYDFFFNLPYPVFFLTVKGYYGKTVTMPLYLLKTNTKFDGQSGDYRISCSFTTRTFGVLNDMILFYAMVVPYMFEQKNGTDVTYEGRQVLQKIFERQRKKAASNNTYWAFGKNTYTLFDLSNLDSIVKEVYDGGNPAININKVKLNQLASAAHILDQYVSEFNASYDSLENAGTTSEFKELASDSDIEDIMKRYQDELKKYPYFQELYTSDTFGIYDINTIKINGATTISSKPLLTAINKVKELINDRSSELKLDVSQNLTNLITDKLGFKPTVANITTIVVNNMQAFLELLKIKSIEAVKQIKTTDRLKGTNYKSQTFKLDGQERTLVFPDYYKIKTGERSEKIYPGEVPSNLDWKEVEFIEEIFRARERFHDKIRKSNASNYTTTSLNIVTPFELPTFTNKYVSLDLYGDIVPNMLETLSNVLTNNGLLYSDSDIEEEYYTTLFNLDIDNLLNVIEGDNNNVLNRIKKIMGSNNRFNNLINYLRSDRSELYKKIVSGEVLKYDYNNLTKLYTNYDTTQKDDYLNNEHYSNVSNLVGDQLNQTESIEFGQEPDKKAVNLNTYTAGDNIIKYNGDKNFKNVFTNGFKPLTFNNINLSGLFNDGYEKPNDNSKSHSKYEL